MTKKIMLRKPKIDVTKPSKVFLSKTKINRGLGLTRLGKIWKMKKYSAEND